MLFRFVALAVAYVVVCFASAPPAPCVCETRRVVSVEYVYADAPRGLR